jgi:hypothetical protein
MQRVLRIAVWIVAAGLLAPALPVRAANAPRVASHAAAKPPAKPKAKPKLKAAKAPPKHRAHKVAVPKRSLKKKAGPPPVRTGLHAAQALAEPALVAAAAILVNTGSWPAHCPWHRACLIEAA